MTLEQATRRLMQNIADNQLAVAPAIRHGIEKEIGPEYWLKRGQWEGLEMAYGIVHEWINDNADLLKKHEWIKCSHRMPEERDSIFKPFKDTDKWSPAMFEKSSDDVRVVIVFADGTKRVSHSHTVDGRWECEKSPVKRIVTHWMPNPELPEEGR